MSRRKSSKEDRSKSRGVVEDDCNSAISDPSSHSLSFEQLIRRLENDVAEGQVSFMKNISAKCQEGRVKSGHGIMITVEIDSIFSDSLWMTMSLDIYQSKLFSSLPSGMGYLAPALLPIDVRVAPVNDSAGGSGTRLKFEFGIGLKKLSRGRINEVLQSIIQNGDDPFVFEMRNSRTGQLYGFLPTKASLIRASLEDNRGLNIRFGGSLPRYSSKGKSVLYLKWLKVLFLFAIACWMLFLYPEAMLARVPSVYSPEVYSSRNTVADVLPLHPVNMSAAFQMGVLREQLDEMYHRAASLSSPVNQSAVQSLLQQAAILGGKSSLSNISEAQLRNSLEEIKRIESKVSIVTRVRGFFSFVNCIWFFSILGICVSIGPSLYSLLSPLREIILRISKKIFEEIILPLVSRCHSWGIFEILMFASCWLLIAEGYRLEGGAGDGVGLMVSLTGSLLSIPCLFYSNFLWGKRLIKNWKRETLLQLLHLWLIICWTPCAIHFQSTLYGYGVVIALFSIAGFEARISPLLIMIGFDSEKEALRCTFASFFLILLQVLLRAFHIDSYLITPFSSGIAVIGNNVYFLSLLILSFRHNHKFFFNSAMIFSLLFFQLIGHIFGISGMANVSVTYTVLWSLMKYADFHVSHSYDIWVLVLIMSVAIWRFSLFLHLHPEYITCLFGMGL